VASLPAMKKMLEEARAKGVMVVHTTGPNGTPAALLPEVALKGDEPFLSAGPDKFLGTELEKTLKDKGIRTVIAVGTSANGALLYTASGAALRGMKVLVPVDGATAADPYLEQITVHQLATAPLIGSNVTLTRSDMLKY
jgi:nicotinamidase-related amidase